MSPAPIPKHQLINGQTYTLLRNLVPNGQVFYAPIDVHLGDENVVQPDLLWIADGSRCVIGEKRLEGSPDLIVEIFSPGTTRRDKITKFNLYERYGVREYWMIDPQEQYIEVFCLKGEKFERQGVFAPGETFISAVLGDKVVDVSAVFGN